MVLALLLLAALADQVPMRWPSGDPKSLELLSETPVNCILLEQNSWSPELAAEASRREVATLGVIRPDADPIETAQKALGLKLTGIVLEGDFSDDTAARLRALAADRKAALVELPRLAKVRITGQPVIGTYQGVWPGIQIQEDGEAHAAPTGGPWINTNTGFLRYLHAAAADSTIWIANTPPPGTVFPAERYLQAIGDAAINGARWVVALDADLSKRLMERESTAVRDWKRVAEHLRFYEEHAGWRELQPAGQLALVQALDRGALVAGGILDMIAVKHTPVRPVPGSVLSDERMKGAKMAVDVDPNVLTDEQKEVLRRFTRSGGTLLSGPPGWQFTPVADNEITIHKDDVAKLDAIWKDVNAMTGRRNLGVRLFNVSSMLSNLLGTSGSSKLVLHLVNYTSYPVENITAHVLWSYKTAVLYSPGHPPRKLAPYPIEEGTGLDIDQMESLATIVIE